MTSVRLLIIDDQPSMRRVIKTLLQRDRRIEVVGEAGSANEARAAIKTLNPDVITLDVEMPGMNGLEFLERLMRLRPMPAIMVSSSTIRGADLTVRALELGAVDWVAKPSASDPLTFFTLADKVCTAAKAKVAAHGSRPADGPALQRPAMWPTVVAIGASTGGVDAIREVLSKFPRDCPPTVVVQHMPALFTKSFAERLDRICACTVKEATEGHALQAGTVLIAPGGETHMEVAGRENKYCRLLRDPPIGGHRPAVDVLFRSVAMTVGASAVGAILTGMGRDGAEGLLAMKHTGARTYAQDRASCVVFGMPRAAAQIGAADEVVPLNQMAAAILSTPSRQLNKGAC